MNNNDHSWEARPAPPKSNGGADTGPGSAMTFLGILALVFMFPASQLRGDSVPEKPAASFRWGGASSPNMVSTARNLPTDPGNTEPLWEIKTGTHQYSIPTLDRGRIFVAANDSGIERAGFRSTGGGVVMCVEQATGKLIWQLPVPRYFAGVK